VIGLLVAKTRLKRGRPIDSKDKNSRMRKWAKIKDDLIEKVEIPMYFFDIINDSILEEPQILEIVNNYEISINYVMNKIIRNQNKFHIYETFVYNVVMNIMSDNEDQELMIIEYLDKEMIDQKEKRQFKHN